MSDEEEPRPIPLVPGQFPTGRASHAMVFHAGGTFVISFLDERMVVNEGKISSANFEAAGSP